MDHPVSKGRALLLSASVTIMVNVLKFYPPSAAWMEPVESFVAHLLRVSPTHEWLAKAVLFVVLTLVLYAVVKSRAGVWLFNKLALSIRLVLARFGRRRMVFAAEERNTFEFKADVLYSARHSQKMYCLLVSAYTMVHEEERFMLGNWLTNKDVRVLLLERESALWKERARLFIDKRLGGSGRDADHYKAECEIAEQELKNKFRAQIAFYNGEVKWRLYIFDDRVFISRYSGPPEGAFWEARDGPVVAFPTNHPMYRWLYAEFFRLAPSDWKTAMQKP